MTLFTSPFDPLFDEFFEFPSTFRLVAQPTSSDQKNSNNSARSVQRRPPSLAIRLDVAEHPDSYSIHADLPGVQKSDIQVSVEDNTLTITAKRETVHKEDTATRHLVERASGQVTRALRLPPNADTDKLTAQYEHGVLQLTVPKVPEETPKRKTIAIA